MYGFAKLNGAQFTILDSELSKPLGQVSGFWLTWYYFGYSVAYGSFLALVEIGAGVLLVWPRWSLAGALLLCPVVANIVLIDVFYGVDMGGIVAALVLLGCVLATIAPHVPRLRAAIVPIAPTEPGTRWRVGVVVALLIAGCGFTWWIANYNNRSPTPIDGEWAAVHTASAGTGSEWNDVFFERNRARMVVFRSTARRDEQHDFELDSDRTLRIWKTWLTHDSLVWTGRWAASDSIVLVGSGNRAADTLILKRLHGLR